MKVFISICLSLLLCMSATSAVADTQAEWWPSEWGADDERGAANRLTPAKVLEAVALIEEGKVYELGRNYESGMPMYGDRHFKLTIPGLPTWEPDVGLAVVYNDEMISGELGQVGTQFDGLGHIGTKHNGENVFYNGFKLSEFGTSRGLTKIGVEKVGAIFTRGVLIDVARYKDVSRLSPTYEITVVDIKGALAAQDVAIGEGDAVFIHTGWGQLWNVDNEAYYSTQPGLGLDAIKWLVARKIVLTAADNWGTEVAPPAPPRLLGEGHQWLLNFNGVYNLENLDLSELAADQVYEFAFIFSPLKLVGATGSPGNPIAVR
jgi:kynurenine formamidase